MCASCQIQEESNRAAARFDKASSQYAAAKEMIKVTEGELANVVACNSSSGSSDTSSLNHALLEVLNHATTKVSHGALRDLPGCVCGCRWWRQRGRRGRVKLSIVGCSIDAQRYWMSTALLRENSVHTLSSPDLTMSNVGRVVSDWG